MLGDVVVGVDGVKVCLVSEGSVPVNFWVLKGGVRVVWGCVEDFPVGCGEVVVYLFRVCDDGVVVWVGWVGSAKGREVVVEVMLA